MTHGLLALIRAVFGQVSLVVRSARSFLGRPYRWGGPSPESGLDCSGLTMTAYRLNGLALPRASAEQFAGGEPIPVRGLQEADLVFFATEDATKPTHVGLSKPTREEVLQYYRRAIVAGAEARG
jgi:cell wall-associated NlpC family hydrolase